MNELANRVKRIQSFRVMEFVKRAQSLESQGHPVIHLSIGEPDFGAAPEVIGRLETALANQSMQYTPALGIEPLRRAISGYYKDRFRVDVDPRRIIVTAGASAALTLACAALVNPGDRVLMADPGYPCNRHFVMAFDGEPKLVACAPEQRFQLDRHAIAKHWDEHVKGCLIASPANPTGTSLPFEELRACVELVGQKGGFTVVDEIYLELSYGVKPRTVLEHTDKVIVTNSFSKFFNMTGWRLGWLVAPLSWVSAFEKLAQNLYICPSALAQQAALACFTKASLELFDQRKQQFEERRDYLVPALKSIGFGIPCEPDGAFYVYADVSPFNTTAQELADRLLNEAHVSVVPGDDFGFAQPRRYVRISYANSLENIKEAVDRMDRMINGTMKRTQRHR